MAETCPVPDTKEIDIYRDTPVRLLGYANEVGEAFRALVSVKFVIGTYGVASAYVLADTYDKASKVSIRFERKTKILGLSLAFYMKFFKIGFTILPLKNEVSFLIYSILSTIKCYHLWITLDLCFPI